ncbi:MAG TPA: hypothetical protein VIP57_10670, partial [Candidatus Dormibacteraeota bacterium]
MSGQMDRQATSIQPLSKETPQMNVPKSLSRRRRMLAMATLAVALAVAALGAGPAQADYGFKHFDVEFTDPTGAAPETQAGSHDFAVTTRLELNWTSPAFFKYFPDGESKDVVVEQIAGLIGNATALPRCSTVDFLTTVLVEGIPRVNCPDNTAVGATGIALSFPIFWGQTAVYNLQPPPGVPVRLGFEFSQVKIVIDVGVKGSGEYNVVANTPNIPQILVFFGAALQLWGDPSDPVHDHLRGHCLAAESVFGISVGEFAFVPGANSCPVQPLDKAFLTLPSACNGPLATSYETDSWQEPGKWVSGSVLTHDGAEPPNSQGFTGCGQLDFSPEVEAKTTTDQAESGTGMDFNVDFNDEGLINPDGLAGSEAKKAVVTLPEGMTVDPSIAEGLGVCTPADINRETLHSAPGEGCPDSSKIGTLHLDTPLVEEGIDGSVFLAQQDDPATTTPGAENPFDSLIALYLVLKNPNLGAIVKLPLKVEPDPSSGQLVATLENIPQIPFSHFNFHFREGQRPALITPPACGTYTTNSVFTPWSDPANPRTVNSDFQITSGVNGG